MDVGEQQQQHLQRHRRKSEGAVTETLGLTSLLLFCGRVPRFHSEDDFFRGEVTAAAAALDKRFSSRPVFIYFFMFGRREMRVSRWCVGGSNVVECR